jgi:hypothetical protein
MDYLVSIDSGLKLSETEQRCEVEQNAGFQLDNIKFSTVVDAGNVFTINKAEFNYKSSFTILNDLHFVELVNNDPKTVSDEKKKSGWIPICNTQIYVENHIKRVLVFGKKS